MSYYNPKIYNYSNLHRDDQMTVDVMNWAIDAVENMEIDYRPTEDSSIMEKMCGTTSRKRTYKIDKF